MVGRKGKMSALQGNEFHKSPEIHPAPLNYEPGAGLSWVIGINSVV